MEKETKVAYKLLTNRANVLLKKHLSIGYFRKGLDFRTNFNKSVFNEIRILSATLDFNEIAKKQKERAQNRYVKPKKNYLNNPLFVDSRRNKSSIKYISDSCIYFSNGRNHWAKDNDDLLILSILKKNFINSKKND